MVVEVLVLLEVIDAEKILEIPYGLRAHAVTYKVYLVVGIPPLGYTIREAKYLLISSLPQQPRLIECL